MRERATTIIFVGSYLFVLRKGNIFDCVAFPFNKGIFLCYNWPMLITIFAHTNSKKPRVEKDLFGNLHVHVSEPPLEGRANMAILLTLADYLQVKRSQVRLARGEKSKQKVFEVEGHD